MGNKALMVIDIQNDITKNYKKIIDRINQAIDWAVTENMQIIYIKHNNLSPGTRTFKPDTKGAELVPEMKVVSDNIFVKTKANALTSEEFTEFIEKNGINEFFIAGADATGCVKSTCFNMTKAGYSVHVISDCVTSYDLKKMDEMYAYYEHSVISPSSWRVSKARTTSTTGAFQTSSREIQVRAGCTVPALR